MKKQLVTALFLVSLLCLNGCGGAGSSKDGGKSGGDKPTAEGLAKDSIAAMNDLAAAMDKKDLEATKAAIKRMKDIEKQLKDMKVPDDEKKKLQEKYDKEMKEAAGKMMAAMIKVADNKEFQDALKDLK
jgi:hypothetical protein